ncbi:ArnT family glycosyltransferase [Pollutibacter soli]|uniref:ArnT family glycosyltransferase n=1 Tax=Pollutibacter soli TaxID=3034157 RepID=UPI003013BBD6
MSLSSFIQRNHRKLFYLCWALLSIVQAAGTGLFDDEAYYWVYSRFPDWGYFDHPPMIAILIKTGYYFFQNEFGVRLLIVAMSTATVAAIDSLISQKNDRLFYAIVLSMGLLQIGSIIAVPDVPLLFFIALFFLAYRRFSSQPDYFSATVLGMIMALMLYSKYHAVLVIFFTLLSNLRLLAKPQTWLAAIIALLLFAPHLAWQYQHDFISIQYHLFERNATVYQFNFTTEYVIGQILLVGPLIGWLLLWSSAKHKPESALESALKWTFAGVYLLFFVSTFKGRSEANWTVPALISVIIIAHQYLLFKPALSKWIFRLAIPSLVLILAARFYMLMDVPPVKWIKKDAFHKNRPWAAAIKEQANGLPVVFINSYQRASQYWFYSGDTSFAMNNIFYRRNNYNFWPLEERLQHRKVLVVSGESSNLFSKLIVNPKRKNWYYIADDWFSFSHIRIYGPSKMKAPAHHLKTSLEFIVPRSLEQAKQLGYDSAAVSLVLYYHDNDPGLIVKSNLTVRDIAAGKTEIDMVLPASVPAGHHRARWAINSCLPGLPSLNSISYSVDVE